MSNVTDADVRTAALLADQIHDDLLAGDHNPDANTAILIQALVRYIYFHSFDKLHDPYKAATIALSRAESAMTTMSKLLVTLHLSHVAYPKLRTWTDLDKLAVKLANSLKDDPDGPL